MSAGQQLSDLLSQLMLGQNTDAAEKALTSASEADFGSYLLSLIGVLADKTQPQPTRQMAGVVVKNALTKPKGSQKEEQAAAVIAKWGGIDPGKREEIRNALFAIVSEPTAVELYVKQSVAMAVAALHPLAAPCGEADMVSLITAAAQSNEYSESAALMLRYTCDLVEDEDDLFVGEDTPALVLGCVRSWLENRESSSEVTLEATMKIVNAFADAGCCEMQEHLELILTPALKILKSHKTPLNLRVETMKALTSVVSVFKTEAEVLMESLLEITFSLLANQHTDDELQLAAINFLTTIVEGKRDVEDDDSHGTVTVSVLATILEIAMIKMQCQDEDSTDEDWTVSVSAGVLLKTLIPLLSASQMDSLKEFATEAPFRRDVGWREQEAALMALGLLMEEWGPGNGEASNDIVDLVAKVPQLLTLVQDPNISSLPLVRDTACWVLACVGSHPSDSWTTSNVFPQLLQFLFVSDDPQVVKHGLSFLMNLCSALSEETSDECLETPLSPYATEILTHLFVLADKEGFRPLEEVCETMNSIVSSARVSPDLLQEVLQRVLVYVEKQGRDGADWMSVLNSVCRELTRTDQVDLLESAAGQIVSLCSGCLNETEPPAAEVLMCLEVVMPYVGTSTLGESIELVGHTIGACFRGNDELLCRTAACVAGEVLKRLEDFESSSIVSSTMKTAVNELFDVLERATTPRKVRPALLSSAGDWLINAPRFRRDSIETTIVLPRLFENTIQAAAQTVQACSNGLCNDDEADYQSDLCEALFMCFTSLAQTTKNIKQVEVSHVSQLANAVATLTESTTKNFRSETLAAGAVGSIGDLYNALGNDGVLSPYHATFVTTVENAKKIVSSSDMETVEFCLREMQAFERRRQR